MAAIPLTLTSIRVVKAALLDDSPFVRSSHLYEALAAALRRRTYASLRPELCESCDDPPIELLDDVLYDRRLQELGYPPDPEFSFELLPNAGLISTTGPRAWTITYTSERTKLWRNLMVAAINAGLILKLFSVRPDDNRWPSANEGEAYLYDFRLPNGMPAKACVDDIGYGELVFFRRRKPDWRSHDKRR